MSIATTKFPLICIQIEYKYKKQTGKNKSLCTFWSDSDGGSTISKDNERRFGSDAHPRSWDLVTSENWSRNSWTFKGTLGEIWIYMKSLLALTDNRYAILGIFEIRPPSNKKKKKKQSYFKWYPTHYIMDILWSYDQKYPIFCIIFFNFSNFKRKTLSSKVVGIKGKKCKKNLYRIRCLKTYKRSRNGTDYL